ncbi:MAG: carbohydrate kinase family protein [Patescibacteria group bacterium]|nr:carbohydrate kinase family protein [Patescibacteria group bacterium]MDE2438550.1 carbohydrate kinase family protein [Patescibacteria group bacterium]
MKDIICIGSVTRDHFLESEYQFVNWDKTPSHKALIFPVGEKVEISNAFSTLGGNAANASVTFARHGFRVFCCGKIGNDSMGRALQEDLTREHVATELLEATSERHTAFSTLLLSGGERTILGYHGASDTFSTSDIHRDAMRAPWWYLSLAGESYHLFPELLTFAHSQGIKVAFNPSGYHIKRDRDGILAALKNIAVLLVNEGEAATLLGISFEKPEEVFSALDRDMPGIVAMTNGPQGVTVSDGTKIYRAGIFNEQVLRDRTGAGDAFGSGFVAGLMRKNDISYAIRLGTANAASVVEHVGGTAGILTKDQFEHDARWKDLAVSVTPSS